MAKGKRRGNIDPETARRISQTLANKQPLSKKQMLGRVKNKPYLTTAEVAGVFDVHPVTLYKWVRLGHLAAYRVKNRGKANLYLREDVVRLVESRFCPRLASTGASIREKTETHDDDQGDPQARAVRHSKNPRPKPSGKKATKR